MPQTMSSLPTDMQLRVDCVDWETTALAIPADDEDGAAMLLHPA